MDDWRGERERHRPAKDSYLLGASATGNLQTLNWALSGYSFDGNAVGESRVSLPVTESIQINLQNMAASDRSPEFGQQRQRRVARRLQQRMDQSGENADWRSSVAK